ncbi:putative aquaporin TIP1-1-like [Capsicum annuum]|nr:putative aquaporin TIP1-1-like [Capsicum annuum]
MAVPRGRNGEEEGGDIFEEEFEFEDPNSVPPHLLNLFDAAENGNLDALRHALDNLTGSIDQPLEDGDTALHLTCLYGHLSCVQLLLERGASLEAKDEDGALPLHDACAGGYTEIAQLLINSAPNPDCVKRMLESVDVEGDTHLVANRVLVDFEQPLHHAARGEHVNVIRLLLASGACPTKTNIYGKSPGELAAPDTEPQRILEEAASAVPSH